MTTATLVDYRGPEGIAVQEMPIPEVYSGTVLVEVFAAGVNPIDWKIAKGFLRESKPLPLPFTLGSDIAGIVRSIGQPDDGNRPTFRNGDRVFGQSSVLAGDSRAFAEYATAKMSAIAPVPDGLSWSTAASLPLVGVSAVQALIEHLSVAPGQKILIHGGAGGIGSIAIQIAKQLGAYVYTTVSTDDVEFAGELGADRIIDYKRERFEDAVRTVDAVFDTVGGDVTSRSLEVIAAGGKLVTMAGDVSDGNAVSRGITVIRQQTRITSDRLSRLSAFLAAGLRTFVEHEYPLTEVPTALERLHITPPRGKLVIRIR